MSKNLATFLLSLVVLGVVTGGYVFLYTLEQQAFSEAEAVFQQGNELRATALKVALLKNESTGLEADEKLFASYFVRKEDIVQFLEYVERSGASRGVLVEVVSVGDVQETEVLTLAVEIQGSFTGVLETLADLEYGTYALMAKNINLEKTTEGAWKLRGNFNALSHTP